MDNLNGNQKITRQQCVKKFIELFSVTAQCLSDPNGTNHVYCEAFRTNSVCKYFPECDYAHGMEQLKPRFYKSKHFKRRPCLKLVKGCSYGKKCLFVHDDKCYVLSPELRIYHSVAHELYRITLDMQFETLLGFAIGIPRDPERDPKFMEYKPYFDALNEVCKPEDPLSLHAELDFQKLAQQQQRLPFNSHNYAHVQPRMQQLHSSLQQVQFAPQFQYETPQFLAYSPLLSPHLAAAAAQSSTLQNLLTSHAALAQTPQLSALFQSQYLHSPPLAYAANPQFLLTSASCSPVIQCVASPALQQQITTPDLDQELLNYRYQFDHRFHEAYEANAKAQMRVQMQMENTNQSQVQAAQQRAQQKATLRAQMQMHADQVSYPKQSNSTSQAEICNFKLRAQQNAQVRAQIQMHVDQVSRPFYTPIETHPRVVTQQKQVKKQMPRTNHTTKADGFYKIQEIPQTPVGMKPSARASEDNRGLTGLNQKMQFPEIQHHEPLNFKYSMNRFETPTQRDSEPAYMFSTPERVGTSKENAELIVKGPSTTTGLHEPLRSVAANTINA